MAYGKIKADAFIYDDGGSDTEITAATIASNSNKAPTASPTFTGTVTMPATVALAGQASDVTIIDNNTAALEIKEGSNTYVTFSTSNSEEQIEVAKPVVASDNITLNAQKELRLADSNSSNYVALKSPATVASNVTLTLPDTDGNPDQYLQTNGSGGLTWADVAGGYTWTSQVDFDGDDTWSSIPTDTTEIVILWAATKSTTGSIKIRLGGGGSQISSGYVDHRGYFQSSTPNVGRNSDAFYLYGEGHSHSGVSCFKRNSNNNKWVYSGVTTMYSGTNYMHLHAGYLDMGSTALDQLSVYHTAGTASGTISLGYK